MINTSRYNLSFGYRNSSDTVKSNQNSDGGTRTSIFYINDFHGKAMNMERTVSASLQFDRYTPTEPTDKLKLASGDIMLGEDIKINKVALAFLKMLGIKASAVGNHECDMKSSDFESIAKEIPNKLLACNIANDSGGMLSKYIEKSYVQEINGTKYGIIGTIPCDLTTRIKYGKVFQDQDITPADINQTIKCIQTEIDKFKSQGINKIILLSHSGYGYDIKIAQNTDGLDVILGGHSHTLLKDIKEGVNLFYSKSGEPVVITQGGRDGKNFGILNLEFDKDGIIKKVQNNVGLTRNFHRNAIARQVFEKIQGKPEVIGEIRTAPPILKNDLTEPNPLAYYGLDAIREKTGADIALVGSANIRGSIEKGKIDTSGVEEISPFKNKILKINYTEKEIVDAIKLSAKSMIDKNNKPGIMYVSGLKYVMTKDGVVTDIRFIEKDGGEKQINVDNPRTDKIYSVAINDYFSSGNDGYSMLDKFYEATEHYPWDLNYAVEQKIRASKEPIDMIDDGRITIIE